MSLFDIFKIFRDNLNALYFLVYLCDRVISKENQDEIFKISDKELRKKLGIGKYRQEMAINYLEKNDMITIEIREQDDFELETYFLLNTEHRFVQLLLQNKDRIKEILE